MNEYVVQLQYEDSSSSHLWCEHVVADSASNAVIQAINSIKSGNFVHSINLLNVERV